MHKTVFSKLPTIISVLFLILVSSVIANAAPPVQNPNTFNSTYYTINVNGVQRSLLFHLPAGYVQGSKLPVLFNFHGYGSDASTQEVLSDMSRLADKYGFIVIYPEGLYDAGGKQFWNTHLSQDQQTDLDFVREMLRLLDIYYGYEPTRVYATGFSNGGGFANLLANKMSDTFAAVSSVAGAYFNYNEYPLPRPVPIIAFHGTTDTVVPFDGFFILPAVYDWVNDWIVKNACAPTADVIVDAGDIYAERWATDCESTVELYTIKGKGHSWPGATLSEADNTNQINASQIMIEFFAKHPLR